MPTGHIQRPAAGKPNALKQISAVPGLAERSGDSHKGDFGRVLVLAGSVGMSGAPALVGLAAQRGGAGLVTIATVRSVQPVVSGLCPCATTIGLPETKGGRIHAHEARKTLIQAGWLPADSARNRPDVLVTGPGVGTGSRKDGAQFWKLVDAFRITGDIPVIADADALNLLHGLKTDATRSLRRTIITPHPGEMARLHEVTIGEVQADREGYAIRTARQLTGNSPPAGEEAPVVVLKGAGTIVTDAHRIYINRTGNPGMATGGSGDVLAGVIAALVGQKMSLFDAAVAGVYVHGLAGDIAAKRLGRVSMIATDLIDALPEAFRAYQARGGNAGSTRRRARR